MEFGATPEMKSAGGSVSLLDAVVELGVDFTGPLGPIRVGYPENPVPEAPEPVQEGAARRPDLILHLSGVRAGRGGGRVGHLNVAL